MISLHGKASIALTFDEKAIIHVAKKMLKYEATNINGEIIDLTGELSNMVMGGVKKSLAENGFDFQLAFPTIIVGFDYVVFHQTQAPVISIPFFMPEGSFSIEASLERNTENA